MLIIFRSRLRAESQAEYAALAPTMLRLAQSMPGFVSYESFVAEDGERLALIEFESDETLRAWREHPEHLASQRAGRERFYAEYSLQVCETIRTSEFRAPTDAE